MKYSSSSSDVPGDRRPPYGAVCNARVERGLPDGGRCCLTRLRGVMRLRSACMCLLVVIVCGTGAGCKTPMDPSIKGVYGPAGRDAQAALEEQRRLGSLNPVEGIDEFEQAKVLFEGGQFEEARKAFKKIKKKYKDKPIEEDAMFMMAECSFLLEKYPAAQDDYDALFKKYTSTRYTDQVTRRLFKIAQIWLKFPKPTSDLELAAYSAPDTKREDDGPEAPVPYTFPLTPNLFDRTRPVFDTQGRAIQALTSIWLHDSTGPLADDALMMAATYHLRKRDFQESDRFFKLVREQYPQSEYAQASYVIGAHAKLMTYQGARYDGQTLKDASNLTQSTIRMFPDLPQRENMLDKLQKIRQHAAERDWARVEYHMRRKEKTSAALYCEMIIDAHPQSPYAEKARDLLNKLKPEDVKVTLHPRAEALPYMPADDSGLPADDSGDEGYPGRDPLSEQGAEGGESGAGGGYSESGGEGAAAGSFDR